jgi:hypothetical protein
MTRTPDHIIETAQANADSEARFADATLTTLRRLLNDSDRPRTEQVLALANQYVHHAHRERASVEVVRALRALTPDEEE